MNTISRICPQCGKDSPLEARHCAHCGYDTQTGLARANSNLPVVIGKMALPILASAAGLMLRFGWKLLTSRTTQDVIRYAARKTVNTVVQASQAASQNRQNLAAAAQTQVTPSANPQTQVAAAGKPKRTIHIRSAWMVGDGKNFRQQGASEHTIEIDE